MRSSALPRRFRIASALCTLLAVASLSSALHAQIVFSNDFETATTGFSAGGQVSLPVDAGGFGSPNTSNYLGLFDANDFTELTLGGLIPGSVYGLSFDLFAGRSLDGSGSSGPDVFRLSAGLGSGGTFSSTATLVDATFGNIGALQTYSDATPTGGTATNPSLTGADVAFTGGGTFGNYGIYYFSHGAATNPQLTFIAPGETTTLRFAAVGLQDESDEFFALDNVIVTGQQTNGNGTAVPDNGTTLILLGGALLALACVRRFAMA